MAKQNTQNILENDQQMQRLKLLTKHTCLRLTVVTRKQYKMDSKQWYILSQIQKTPETWESD
jgi:hypothetical protein